MWICEYLVSFRLVTTAILDPGLLQEFFFGSCLYSYSAFACWSFFGSMENKATNLLLATIWTKQIFSSRWGAPLPVKPFSSLNRMRREEEWSIINCPVQQLFLHLVLGNSRSSTMTTTWKPCLSRCRMDADRKASMVSLVANDPTVGCSAAEPLYFGVRGIVRGGLIIWHSI